MLDGLESLEVRYLELLGSGKLRQGALPQSCKGGTQVKAVRNTPAAPALSRIEDANSSKTEEHPAGRVRGRDIRLQGGMRMCSWRGCTTWRGYKNCVAVVAKVVHAWQPPLQNTLDGAMPFDCTDVDNLPGRANHQ